MQLFLRKSLVQAFRLPKLGQIADETPPQWLVTRLQTGEFEMNRFGGVTISNEWGLQQCAAGDVVVLFADNSIGFEKPEKFEKDYEPFTSEMLKAA